jgi:endoglucanase
VRFISKSILFSILFLLSSSVFAQGFLHTSGRKIVDGNGQDFYLEGIGLGGWILQEGYMLQMSNFANAAHEIRAKIVDLVGEANADIFYEAYRANYVNRADINAIGDWGFNSIRLPLHYNLLTPPDQPGVYLEEGFAVIDSLLQWCEENQIYLIIDLHAAPGGQSDEPISDYDPNVPSLWEDPAKQDRTVEIWRKIAERYHDKEWIGGYDLLNEPKWDLPPNNQPLRDLYERITDTVRAVDNNHILFIEGNWFATDFSGLTPPWDNNMAYSFHKYWNGNNQNAIQYLIDIRNQYNVPLWLGESGENSNVWFTDCIELMKFNDIGYCWWPHKKVSSISGPLSALIPNGYQACLNYWNGGGPRPSQQQAFDGLMALANNLKIENCEFHKDVIDAMFRQTTSSATIPFAANNIPGIVYAPDYDMGRITQAYNDNDYQNIGGTNWNNGWAYRNDGVDIESCSDFFSNGYNVGWIENGEWLGYTVNATQGGIYNLYMGFASPNSGGQVLLKMDGHNITQMLAVPNTGGWQNWGTLEIDSIAFSTGTHFLQVKFFGESFNFSAMEFTLEAAGVNDEVQQIKTFELSQNYPNPFNPATTVKFRVPEEGNVAIKLYDVNGQETAAIMNEVKTTGTYYIQVDAGKLNLSSGVYYLRAIYKGRTAFTRKLVLIK